jgi:hypothetical protein
MPRPIVGANLERFSFPILLAARGIENVGNRDYSLGSADLVESS